MALFESYERRIDKINAVLNSYGIASIEEAEKITKDAGLEVYDQIKKIQMCIRDRARANAYAATEWVQFANKYKRNDIGKAIDEL